MAVFWMVVGFCRVPTRGRHPGANTPPPHPKRSPGGHPNVHVYVCHHATCRKKTAMARSTEGMERMTRSERYGANGTEQTVRSEIERD